MTNGTRPHDFRHINYQPMMIGNRFAIVPPTTDPMPKDHIPLIMARGAFGSGDHETTRSCLEILENLSLPCPPKILDLGSGTGILTIAAVKLFGGEAWCVDIEEAAVACAESNCQLNQIGNVNHHCGTLDTLSETGFDLILANIYGDILFDVATDLVSRAKSGATLLLSGILWEYNFDVRRAYQQLGCEVSKNYFLEDFSTVVLKKTSRLEVR